MFAFMNMKEAAEIGENKPLRRQIQNKHIEAFELMDFLFNKCFPKFRS